jgi:hypothetical protein
MRTPSLTSMLGGPAAGVRGPRVLVAPSRLTTRMEDPAAKGTRPWTSNALPNSCDRSRRRPPGATWAGRWLASPWVGSRSHGPMAVRRRRKSARRRSDASLARSFAEAPSHEEVAATDWKSDARRAAAARTTGARCASAARTGSHAARTKGSAATTSVATQAPSAVMPTRNTPALAKTNVVPANVNPGTPAARAEGVAETGRTVAQAVGAATMGTPVVAVAINSTVARRARSVWRRESRVAATADRRGRTVHRGLRSVRSPARLSRGVAPGPCQGSGVMDVRSAPLRPSSPLAGGGAGAVRIADTVALVA